MGWIVDALGLVRAQFQQLDAKEREKEEGMYKR